MRAARVLAAVASTDSGTPLPPRSPAATNCQASARYTAAHVAHTDSRRHPHAFNTTPPG